MSTVTLIAAPDRRDLTPAALADLPASWALGPARWLADGEAVEACAPGLAPPAGQLGQEVDEVRALWHGRGVDLVVQPARGRRKQVLVTDMDSTVIQQECIDELAAEAGVGPQVAGITARAMAGELDFEEALHERVAMLSGLPASVVATLLEERITLTPGAAELVGTMRAHGARTALVSGGFTAFTSVIAERLGFHEHHGNVLLVREDRITGEVQTPVLGKEAKVEAVQRITGRLGLTPADAVAVGDGANDLPMLLLAGTGVALHAKPAVAALAPVAIHHGDLTAVLFLQGYAASEFVRP